MENKEIVKGLIKDCLKGKHKFVELLRKENLEELELVARWCKNCGSVVIDLEYDNRLYKAGGIMSITGSEVTKLMNRIAKDEGS